jgi:hypothetical protein
MDSFKLLLILVLLLLIWIWAEESKWMEENWPEIEMDFFWNDGQIDVR